MDFLDGMKTDGRERTYADKDHEIPNGTKMRGHLLMQGCEAVSLEVAPERLCSEASQSIFSAPRSRSVRRRTHAGSCRSLTR